MSKYSKLQKKYTGKICKMIQLVLLWYEPVTLLYTCPLQNTLLEVTL